MKRKLLALAFLPVFLVAPAHADNGLTVVNFGGANANAQNLAYYQPIAKQGVRVIAAEYNGEQAKIKAMVEAKNVTWDVVEVESTDLARGCDEGLFEKLDYSKIIPKADLIPDAATECGVGLFVWSTVMAYNSQVLKTAPTSWADFFDTKKIPGKRGMRKGARYNLEFALMADGVPSSDVYQVLATKEGVERAFKKLTELKPNIQWWEAGAQVPQFLVAGDVVLSTAFNGRIDAADHEGQQLKIFWPGAICEMDYWVIPKGSSKQDLAYQFIAFTMRPEQQAIYAQHIAYGPTNLKARAKLDQALLNRLPSAAQNAKQALQFNTAFWSDQGEVLEKRFAVWAAQ